MAEKNPTLEDILSELKNITSKLIEKETGVKPKGDPLKALDKLVQQSLVDAKYLTRIADALQKMFIPFKDIEKSLKKSISNARNINPLYFLAANIYKQTGGAKDYKKLIEKEAKETAKVVKSINKGLQDARDAINGIYVNTIYNKGQKKSSRVKNALIPIEASYNAPFIIAGSSPLNYKHLDARTARGIKQYKRELARIDEESRKNQIAHTQRYNQLIPYPNTDFTLVDYEGPLKRIRKPKDTTYSKSFRKFEIVPYSQMNSYEIQRMKSILDPRPFSGLHIGAPTDINRATEGLFNRKISTYANPLSLGSWLDKQKDEQKKHHQELIALLQEKFEDIHDSPEAAKWTKKFTESLTNKLKELPIFKTMAKAGTDIIRLAMLGIAGNKNMPDLVRKLSLAGVALKAPESLVALGGVGGDILSTALGIFLYDLIGRGLGKFGKNIFKGEKALSVKPFKNLKNLKLAGGLGISSLAIGSLDLLDPLAEKSSINGFGPSWMRKGNLAGWHGMKGAAGMGLTLGSLGSLGGPHGAGIGIAIGSIVGGLYGIWKGLSTDVKDIKDSTEKLEDHQRGFWEIILGNPNNINNINNPSRNNYYSKYPITSKYGELRDLGRIHKGTDYAMPFNTPVKSAIGGIVTNVQTQKDKEGNVKGWGNYVTVYNKHLKREELYAHLNRQDVKVGQKIEEGQVIGLSGSTGDAEGPHLHREARINGTLVDPESLDSGTSEAYNVINSGKRFRTTRGAVYGYTGG